MHRDGRYAVWFRTPRGEGTGIVELANGIISGSDSFLTYGGSYKVDDDRFTATLTTTRHTAGPPTLFGIDEIELELAGQFKGRMASCSGTARQAPEETELGFIKAHSGRGRTAAPQKRANCA